MKRIVHTWFIIPAFSDFIASRGGKYPDGIESYTILYEITIDKSILRNQNGKEDDMIRFYNALKNM